VLKSSWSILAVVPHYSSRMVIKILWIWCSSDTKLCIDSSVVVPSQVYPTYITIIVFN